MLAHSVSPAAVIHNDTPGAATRWHMHALMQWCTSTVYYTDYIVTVLSHPESARLTACTVNSNSSTGECQSIQRDPI